MILFNKIKFQICFFLSALLLWSCSNDDMISGSGHLVTVSRDVDDFESIQNIGVIDVKVTHEDLQQLEITADDNIIAHLQSKVENGNLKLYLNDDYNYQNVNASVVISARELKSFQNSGSGRISLSGIQTEQFNIKNEGSGKINIEGTADEFTLDLEGSGDVLGREFWVKNCSVKIEGSGDLEISCSQILDVEIEGSGNVIYRGSPVIHTEIHGSGKVINAN